MADVDNQVTIAQGTLSAVSGLIDTINTTKDLFDTMNPTNNRM